MIQVDRVCFSQKSYTKEGKGSKVLLNNKQYDWEGVFSLGKLAKRFECNWMKLLSGVTGWVGTCSRQPCFKTEE